MSSSRCTKLPRLANASNTCLWTFFKVFQHETLDFPHNMVTIWSLPVNAWNPGNATSWSPCESYRGHSGIDWCLSQCAIHRLASFQVPAPLHLCQGCGYWGMFLLSLCHWRHVEAYTCLPLLGYWWGVQLIACWTCTHASGLPHRSLRSLSYTQGYLPNWIALLEM